MSKYKIVTTNEFEKVYKRIIGENYFLKSIIDQKIIQLAEDPFYPGLKTHKVNTRNYNIRYSSRITGDLRIIWDFTGEKLVIIILTIGGHSGKNKVYK